MRSGGTSLFVTSSPRAHSTCSTTPLSADIYQSESLLAICACASSTACRLYECCLSTCVCFVSASLLFPLEYFVVLLLFIVYNCCTIVVLLSCYCYTILVMLLNHYVLLFKLGSNSLLRTQIYANIQQVYNKYTTRYLCHSLQSHAYCSSNLPQYLAPPGGTSTTLVSQLDTTMDNNAFERLPQ